MRGIFFAPMLAMMSYVGNDNNDGNKKETKMMRMIFSKELAERLNVSVATLHKREYRRRIGLPTGKVGRQICCPEPVYNEWALEQAGVKRDV